MLRLELYITDAVLNVQRVSLLVSLESSIMESRSDYEENKAVNQILLLL